MPIQTTAHYDINLVITACVSRHVVVATIAVVYFS